MKKFDPFRVRIAKSGCFLFHGLYLPTGKGRPVVIERFNPFRIVVTQIVNDWEKSS